MTNKKLYLCLTDSCNLACKGCYKPCTLQQISFLDINRIKEVISDMLKGLAKDDSLECVFHGGEPFYLIKDTKPYIELIDTFPNVIWSATTNLMYDLTEDHINLFNKFTNKFIKTSWDVDDYRFKTKDQLNLWEINIRKLIKLGFNIQVIVTVNNQTVLHKPKELLTYFKALGIHIVNFERITETGRAAEVKVKPTNREIDDWLYEVFIVNKEFQLEIPLFEELIHYKQDFFGCRRRECMQNVRTLNTDGSLGACPNCSDKIIKTKDNIYNKNLEDTLIKIEKSIPNPCKFCKFYKICNGDCCQLQFDETGCPGLTKIYEEILR